MNEFDRFVLVALTGSMAAALFTAIVVFKVML